LNQISGGGRNLFRIPFRSLFKGMMPPLLYVSNWSTWY